MYKLNILLCVVITVHTEIQTNAYIFHIDYSFTYKLHYSFRTDIEMIRLPQKKTFKNN